jgi:hypothetical protein
VLAQLDMAIGICRLRLGNHAEARAAFRSAMTGIADDPSSDVEYMCRTGLAEVALADGDLLNAEEQLACCIDLIEHSRASLSSVEGRVRFLNARLPQYETIVAVRLKLGRFTDAYDAARLTKSRTLTELLAEPEHRPIDYALEDDLAAVTLRWNDWISEHLRPPAQPDVEAELRMLMAQQEHSDRRRSIGDARRQRGLFDGLIAHEHPLAFVEVQALLFC